MTKTFEQAIQECSVNFIECEECENGDVMGYIDIVGDNIEMSVNVHVCREWGQGRFYETEESFIQKCDFEVDDPCREAECILKQKFDDVMLGYWRSKFMDGK